MIKALWARTSFAPRIRCDDCNKLFKPNLADQPRPDGSLDRRFLCPHCGKKTVVAHISVRGRDLIKELQSTPITDKKRLAELRKQIKSEVTRG